MRVMLANYRYHKTLVESQIEHMGQPEDQLAQTQFLLDQAARGDEQAYDDLLNRASDRLLKLTRKMLRRYPNLRRWEQTDDVFQNAAIRLHRSLKKVKPDSARSFYGLATVEIRRTLIDLCRHHFGPEGAAGKYQSDIKSAMKTVAFSRTNQIDTIPIRWKHGPNSTKPWRSCPTTNERSRTLSGTAA